MYATSEEAMRANTALSLGVAERELRNHGCRVLDTRGGPGPMKLHVTNDIDPAEWIDCTTRAILEWLGY